jgi:hypothetical protein
MPAAGNVDEVADLVDKIKDRWDSVKTELAEARKDFRGQPDVLASLDDAADVIALGVRQVRFVEDRLDDGFVPIPPPELARVQSQLFATAAAILHVAHAAAVARTPKPGRGQPTLIDDVIGRARYAIRVLRPVILPPQPPASPGASAAPAPATRGPAAKRAPAAKGGTRPTGPGPGSAPGPGPAPGASPAPGTLPAPGPSAGPAVGPTPPPGGTTPPTTPGGTP